MEAFASVHDRLGVFSHLGVQDGDSLVLGEVDRIEIAGSEAAAATHAMTFVHAHFPGLGVIHQPAVGTFPLAAAASAAFFLVDHRFPG